MSITYPLDLPAGGFTGLTIRARSNVGLNVSPFTKAAQTYEWAGEGWELDISLPTMTRASAEAFAAFLLSLHGPVGSFLAGDPIAATSAVVPPTVSTTTGAGSFVLPVSGGTGFLGAGDWFSLGSGLTRRLYKNLKLVSLGGSLTLDIWPSLRASASSGTSLVITKPTGKFMMQSNVAEYAINQMSLYKPADFTAVEDRR